MGIVDGGFSCWWSLDTNVQALSEWIGDNGRRRRDRVAPQVVDDFRPKENIQSALAANDSNSVFWKKL